MSHWTSGYIITYIQLIPATLYQPCWEKPVPAAGLLTTRGWDVADPAMVAESTNMDGIMGTRKDAGCRTFFDMSCSRNIMKRSYRIYMGITRGFLGMGHPQSSPWLSILSHGHPWLGLDDLGSFPWLKKRRNAETGILSSIWLILRVNAEQIYHRNI